VLLFDSNHPTNTWRINGLGFDFPKQANVPAGGLALIVNIAPDTFRAKYAVSPNVPVFGPYAGALQDSGERLTLQRPDSPNLDGSVPYLAVDEVRYNDRAPWPVAADGDGFSLHRLNLDGYGDDPANWFAGESTPGLFETTNPDSDGDGLPDAWELANGTQVGLPDGSLDPDNDGMTNYQEFRTGTSPTNTASVLRLEVSLNPAREAVMSFTRVAGVNYALQYRTNLTTGSWLVLANLAAEPTTSTFNVTNSASDGPSRFYRVLVP